MSQDDIKHTTNSGVLMRLRRAFFYAPPRGDRSGQRGSQHRRSEAGNVFFALFGAVAVVGVLGAGIMSTMRGPLTTMVEVNRAEEARSVIRLNARLVLRNAATDQCDADDFTEAVEPVTCSPSPTGGGCLPSNVGATMTDPWGTAYGYCAWNHGSENAACGNVLPGDDDVTHVAIALISAGPDRQFTTTCANLYTGGPNGDDIAQRIEYNDAAAAAGGSAGNLWTAVDDDNASIDRNIDVQGTANFNDAVSGTAFSATGNISSDLEVASPVVTTDLIQPIAPGSTVELSGNFDISGDLTGGVDNILSIDDGLAVTGTSTFTGDGDFDAALNVDGATTLNNTLAVTGASTLAALTATGAVDFDTTLNVDGNTTLMGELSVDDAATFGSWVTINADGDTAGVDAFVVNNSTPIEILNLDQAGNLKIAGSLAVGDVTDGHIMVADGTAFVSVPVSNDVTIANDGAVTIANDAVETVMILNDAVTNDKLANDAVNTDQIVNGAVTVNKIAGGAAGNNTCLRYNGTDLEWGVCAAGSGGGGAYQLEDLSDVDLTAPANQDCLVFDTSVDPDAWVNVPCSTLSGSPDRIQDSTTPAADTYIDVDTDGTGNVNSIVFTNNGAETLRIASGGGVSIGSGADAAATALLDLTSTTRGFLPPRMTEAQRDDIVGPADGLLVYNTTSDTYDFYDGNATAWTSFATSAGSIANLDDIGDVIAAGATAGNIIKFDGTNWVLSDDLGGDLLFSGNLEFTGGAYGAWSQTGNESAALNSNFNSQGNGMTALNSTTIAYLDDENDELSTFEWDGNDWAQVGNSLSVSISGDRDITALNSTTIAAVHDSTVRTYTWDGTDWSLTGTPLAVGVFFYTSIDSLNSSTIVARMGNTLATLSWNGSNWSLVGNQLAITGSDYNGAVAALNSNTVAVTLESTDEIQTYTWNGSDWTQVGNTSASAIDIANDRILALDTDMILIATHGGGGTQIATYSWDGSDWTAIGTNMTTLNIQQLPPLARLSRNTVAIVDTFPDVIRTITRSEGDSTIADADAGGTLGSLVSVGDRIRVSLSSSNDGIYNVTAIDDADTFVVRETLSTAGPESAQISFIDSATMLSSLVDIDVSGAVEGNCLVYDNDDHVWVASSCGTEETMSKWTDDGSGNLNNTDGGRVGIGKVPDAGVELDVNGDIQYTGTLTDASDIRLKTDIKPLDSVDMMSRISAVDTYTFRMKADTKGQIEYGVMAQEIEKIFPELVRTADDEMGTKSVNYIGLIAPMIEGVKALKAENDALKSEIVELKSSQANIMEQVHGIARHTGYGTERAAFNQWMLLVVVAMLGGMVFIQLRRKTQHNNTRN